MGIKNLHKALSFCTVKDHLDNYRGKRLAVDTSSWLHKSVYSFAEEFVETTDGGRLDPECIRKSSRYIFSRCQELISQYDIQIIFLVMDGKRIPLKAEETEDREDKRRRNLEEARILKRNGRPYQAEEKYRSCIRVRSDFTNEVIQAVQTLLIGNYRVIVVWAPYEADAQMTKLVIDNHADAVVTEDSDVLVYSAAVHVAFPILYKLDRKTGSCDMISLDFLLSMSPDDANKAINSTNNFEAILRKLASRQSKQKGFGVRLFVQSCVLAGCDYVSNTLEGIGVNGAFKLVQENAYRDDNVRFRKILQSLPSKVRSKINIEEYEERLAKSEAVFYYHLVKHVGGIVKPLLTPRMSEVHETNVDDHTKHFPILKRFENDLTFLGEQTPEPNEEKNSDLLMKSAPADQPLENAPSTKRSTGSIVPLSNPYNKKTKLMHGKEPRPLQERNLNVLGSTRGSEVYAGQTSRKIEKKPHVDILKFLQEIPDPRYAKRRFPGARVKRNNSIRLRASSFRAKQENNHLAEEQTANQPLPNPFSKFNHVSSKTTKTTEYPQQDYRKGQVSSFGASNHDVVESGILKHDMSYNASHQQQDCRTHIDLTRPCPCSQSADTTQCFDPVIETELLPKAIVAANKDIVGSPFTTIEFEPKSTTASKYFQSSRELRRVTLEFDNSHLGSPQNAVIRNASKRLKNHCDFGRTHSSESDGIVDSPSPSRGDRRCDFKAVEGKSQSGYFDSMASVPVAAKRLPSPPSNKPGPLVAAFKRQQDFFSQMNSPSEPSPRYSQGHKSFTRKSRKGKDLKSYFAIKPEFKASKSQYYQLPLDTHATDDDFLWNG